MSSFRVVVTVRVVVVTRRRRDLSWVVARHHRFTSSSYVVTDCALPSSSDKANRKLSKCSGKLRVICAWITRYIRWSISRVIFTAGSWLGAH